MSFLHSKKARIYLYSFNENQATSLYRVLVLCCNATPDLDHKIHQDIHYLCTVKKVLSIAILISYCVASFGVSINYFYCCGRLKSVSAVAVVQEKNCNAKPEKGCCKNKTVTIRLKIDQKESDQATYHFASPPSNIILRSDNYLVSDLATNCGLNPQYKRPPPGNLPSKQILYCVFRI